jgi:hypothetical protein
VRLKAIQLGMLAALLAGGGAPRAAAQNPDTLMPDESAALAKKILGKLIQALGGQAYLNVQESECSGRLSQFEHSGGLADYIIVRDYWQFPDKNRTEYVVKGSKVGILSILVGSIPMKGGTVVQLFSGNEGWTLDRAGVSPQPASAIADFQEHLKRDVDHLLRFRLKEEGMAFRYGGLDLVDMHPADWVELTDRDGRTFRLAVRRTDHLLVRSVVLIPNEKMNERDEYTTLYSNYHPLDGVQTPFQISRERNGRKTIQTFYDGCRYNPDLPPDFFTKAGLEKSFGKAPSTKDR